MRSSTTKLAVAAGVVIAALAGMYALTGSVDGASITMAQVRDAMQGIDWMQIINRWGQQQQTAWYSFVTKVQIEIDDVGRIVYSDFKTRKKLHWPPGGDTIYESTLDDAREFAFGSTGPFDMVDTSLRMTQALSNSTLTKELTTYEGQKVERWTAHWDRKNQPGATRKLTVYIDIERKLPIAATFGQTEPDDGTWQECNIEFRYPETGPADIYAAGAPRSAPIKPAPAERTFGK